jgi:hypothetical protein
MPHKNIFAKIYRFIKFCLGAINRRAHSDLMIVNLRKKLSNIAIEKLKDPEYIALQIAILDVSNRVKIPKKMWYIFNKQEIHKICQIQQKIDNKICLETAELYKSDFDVESLSDFFYTHQR